MFEVPLDKITKEQRRDAKAAVFTLLFGGSAKAIFNHARSSGVSMDMEHANAIFDNFFSKFKGINSMRQRAQALSLHNRVVTIKLPNGAKRVLVGVKNAPTVILNTLIQGSAAIGMKMAMLEAHKRGLFEHIGIQVHDELVACVPNSEVEEFSRELSDAMVVGMNSALPRMYTKTEVKVDENWK